MEHLTPVPNFSMIELMDLEIAELVTLILPEDLETIKFVKEKK